MTTTEPLPTAWTRGGHRERVAALKLLPSRVCVLLAAGWARAVLPVWEDHHPQDDRPRKDVEAAEGRAFGTATASASAAAAAYASVAAAAYTYVANADADADAANAYAASAYAAVASVASADAAADAAASAAYAYAHAADAVNKRWRWLYRTYCHARGPEGLVFEPAWKTDTTAALAKEVVAARAFDLMPILADAIQDAGCDNAGLLAHIRNDTDEMTLADWTLCHLLGLWEVTA